MTYKIISVSLQVNPNKIHILEDVIAWSNNHEGGVPETHPAWPIGQDNFDKALKLKGEQNKAYAAALTFIRQNSRAKGIDTALRTLGFMLDGFLVPIHADGGVACQVAANSGTSDYSLTLILLNGTI